MNGRTYLAKCCFVAVALIVSSSPAAAISLGFSPVDQTVQNGTSVDVGLTISGLGDFSPDSLSAFDLDILFDDSILSFTGATFGDPTLGNQLDLFGFGLNPSGAFDLGFGLVNLFEVSLDDPFLLDAFQPGSFTLATLTFNTIGLGTSSLDISVNALGDAFGDPLAVNSLGSATINSVPEPSSMFLLGTGLVGLALRRRRRRST